MEEGLTQPRSSGHREKPSRSRSPRRKHAPLRRSPARGPAIAAAPARRRRPVPRRSEAPALPFADDGAHAIAEEAAVIIRPVMPRCDSALAEKVVDLRTRHIEQRPHEAVVAHRMDAAQRGHAAAGHEPHEEPSPPDRSSDARGHDAPPSARESPPAVRSAPPRRRLEPRARTRSGSSVPSARSNPTPRSRQRPRTNASSASDSSPRRR